MGDLVLCRIRGYGGGSMMRGVRGSRRNRDWAFLLEGYRYGRGDSMRLSNFESVDAFDQWSWRFGVNRTGALVAIIGKSSARVGPQISVIMQMVRWC